MRVDVLDSGVQVEKRLCPFPPLESKLLSLMTPCGTVGLLHDVVAARRGNHLLVINVDQARKLPDRRPAAPQLIGVNDLQDIVFDQEASQEYLCSFRVEVTLKQDVEHEAVLVHRSP